VVHAVPSVTERAASMKLHTAGSRDAHMPAWLPAGSSSDAVSRQGITRTGTSPILSARYATLEPTRCCTGARSGSSANSLPAALPDSRYSWQARL
jgi:hypothetical protein